MDNVLPYLISGTIIVPVPTATSGIHQRGYDQAVLLAQELAKLSNHKTVIAVSRLTQSRQVGSDRKHRLSQLKLAFYITKPQIIKGANVILVDDVLTTGATLEAAVRILKHSGAKSISAIVFAQKQ